MYFIESNHVHAFYWHFPLAFHNSIWSAFGSQSDPVEYHISFICIWHYISHLHRFLQRRNWIFGSDFCSSTSNWNNLDQILDWVSMEKRQAHWWQVCLVISHFHQYSHKYLRCNFCCDSIRRWYTSDLWDCQYFW